MLYYLFAFLAGVAAAALGGSALVWVYYIKNRKVKADSQESAHQLQELSMLTGTLAHEIKNPLSIIKVNLKLLGEDIDNHNVERMKRKISVVRKESERLEQILEGFLRFIGKPELQKVRVNLNDLIEEVIDFYSPQAWKNSVTIRYSPHNQEIICKLDEAMIKQVLLNLFINAQQAIEKAGEIMILTGIDKKYAQILINDTGKGIEREKIDKIFDAFYTSRTGGSGLGLATAKKIIEAHSGTISVSSELGKGSSFKIMLPLAGDMI